MWKPTKNCKSKWKLIFAIILQWKFSNFFVNHRSATVVRECYQKVGYYRISSTTLYYLNNKTGSKTLLREWLLTTVLQFIWLNILFNNISLTVYFVQCVHITGYCWTFLSAITLPINFECNNNTDIQHGNIYHKVSNCSIITQHIDQLDSQRTIIDCQYLLQRLTNILILKFNYPTLLDIPC